MFELSDGSSTGTNDELNAHDQEIMGKENYKGNVENWMNPPQQNKPLSVWHALVYIATISNDSYSDPRWEIMYKKSFACNRMQPIFV